MTRGNGRRELPKAVIFDFDGVILESADIKTAAFLELFAEYPEHQEAILRHHLDHVGVSRYRKFEWIYSELLDRPLDEAESRRLGEAFSEIVLEKILACPFVPGALELLETLRARALLFVASATPQEELEHIVVSRDLRPFFAEVWGAPPTKAEILRSIMTRHGLEEGEVLFIGDGVSDYRAAEETGIPFLARETHQDGIDWSHLGAVTVPDLTAVRMLFALPGNGSESVEPRS